jgi:glycerol-3-phosphate acyltransferase PlsY
VPVLGAIAVLVFVLHRANIGRLLAGTEPKVGSKG